MKRSLRILFAALLFAAMTACTQDDITELTVSDEQVAEQASTKERDSSGDIRPGGN